jgi:hypothetical protein
MRSGKKRRRRGWWYVRGERKENNKNL